MDYMANKKKNTGQRKGTGATTGILCNMCGILLVTINVIVRIVNRKVFKSIEAAVKSALEDQKLIDAYIKNPEAFVFKSKRTT